MKKRSSQTNSQITNSSPLNVTLIYLVFGLLWIAFSDRLILTVTKDVSFITVIQTYKGWFFVIATSLILYYLIRKNTQNLTSNHNLLNQILETVPVGIALVNKEGQITFANKNAENVLGLTKDKITARTYNDPEWKITSLDDSPFPTEQLPFSIVQREGKAVNNIEHAIEYSFGKRTLLSINTAPIKDKHNNFHGMISAIEDITERKRAEEALRKSEENYRMLFREMLSGFAKCEIICDDAGRPIDSRYLEVNPTYERITGKKAEDLLGKRLFEVFPDLEHDWIEILGRVALTGNPEHVEKAVAPLGIWLELMAFCPAPNQYACTFTDITERKRAEEALRESEEKFYKAFQSSPDIMVITSLKDGQIVEVNDRLQEVTGYTNDEIIGKTFVELKFWADPKDRERYTELLQKAGRVRDLEVGFRIKSGEVRDTLLSGEIIDLHDGKYIIGVIRDITERKHIDMKLRSSEERFSNAFHVSPAALTITRIADGKFIDVNESFLRMFGFSREEVIGHTSLELNMLSSEERKKLIQMQIETGGLQNYELQFQTKLGTPIIMLFSSKPMVLEGEECHITTLIDITDRKIAEEKVIKSREELRLLSAHLQNVREDERKNLAREMHDELGQILSSLKMNFVLMQRQIKDSKKELCKKKISEEIQSATVVVDKAVMRVRKLITQLRPELLDKLGLIPALEWYVEEFYKESKLKCQLVSEFENLELTSDVELTIFRTVQEALTNVVKHSGADKVVVKLFKEMGNLIVEINDNGKGFVEEEARKKGSFGLLGMRERAGVIGGIIEIESKLQKGTTVRLILKT